MELVDLAKAFLLAVSADLDQYTSRKGVVDVESPTSVVLLTPSHVQFAKYGRGPGKRPPIDPILEWVSQKGIIFEGLTQEGTAYAIANSIAKKGTLNYVPNAPNAINETLGTHVGDYLSKLSELFLISINDEMKDVKYLPKEMEVFKT
jgi:hypothetical protein